MTCFGKDDPQRVNRLNHRLKRGKNWKEPRFRKELEGVILAEVTEIWTWSLAVGMEGMSGSGCFCSKLIS